MRSVTCTCIHLCIIRCGQTCDQTCDQSNVECNSQVTPMCHGCLVAYLFLDPTVRNVTLTYMHVPYMSWCGQTCDQSNVQGDCKWHPCHTHVPLVFGHIPVAYLCLDPPTIDCDSTLHAYSIYNWFYTCFSPGQIWGSFHMHVKYRHGIHVTPMYHWCLVTCLLHTCFWTHPLLIVTVLYMHIPSIIGLYMFLARSNLGVISHACQIPSWLTGWHTCDIHVTWI